MEPDSGKQMLFLFRNNVWCMSAGHANHCQVPPNYGGCRLMVGRLAVAQEMAVQICSVTQNLRMWWNRQTHET